jgi:hypothetical protein
MDARCRLGVRGTRCSSPRCSAWTARNPDTFTLSIEEGFRLGELTNEAVFGSALRNDETATLSSAD